MTDMTDPHAIRTLIAKGAQRLNTFFYVGIVMGALRGPGPRSGWRSRGRPRISNEYTNHLLHAPGRFVICGFTQHPLRA